MSLGVRPAAPLDLAKAWLDTCPESHLKCRMRDLGYYPTRLLELIKPEPGRIRLLHTQNRIIAEPYITLSHCWGRAEFLTLNAQSYPCLSEGIKVSILRKHSRMPSRWRYKWVSSFSGSTHCAYSNIPLRISVNNQAPWGVCTGTESATSQQLGLEMATRVSFQVEAQCPSLQRSMLCPIQVE
jgi:hypothetical protein